MLYSTGQGFLGYNMFAYCANNPVNCSDSSGCRPKWERGGIFGYTDTGTGDASSNTSAKDKETTQLSPLCSFLKKVYLEYQVLNQSLGFSLGIGQGFEASLGSDLFGASLGMHGNYIQMNLERGKFTFTQNETVHAGITILGIFLGYDDAYKRIFGEKLEHVNRPIDGPITLYSFAFYPLFAGISTDLTFDYVYFLEQTDAIWRESK